MKTRKLNLVMWSLLGVTAVALFLFAADDAEAKVRVKAKVRTPYGVVHVDNGPSERQRVVRRGHLPARRHYDVRITKQDRKVAKRLAWYTGVSKREILRLKRQGYKWGEIGRYLDVSRSVVRAAKHTPSWRRFVNHEQRYERCGTGDYHYRVDRKISRR